MFSSVPDPDHWFFALATQHQRDLIWSVAGPALLDCDWSPTQFSWMKTDGLSPALAERIDCAPEFRSPRLGLMFEQIWHQFFKLQKLLFQANIQIQDGKKTLGELDCVLQTDDKVLHLELALKFYLGFGDEWIGPNRRDYLADKIAHTRDHQLPLADSPIARQALEQLGWQTEQSQALMRGCLFEPANPDIQATLPEEVSANHWSGFWVHQSEAEKYLPEGNWYLLSKPQWISPAQVDFSVSRDTLLRHNKIHFDYLDTALCAVRVVENAAGKWCEQQRWLIMPDHWPNP